MILSCGKESRDAANDANDIPPPTIKAPNPFKINNESNPILPYLIGRIAITAVFSPERAVKICINPEPSWDTDYDMNVMVAEIVAAPGEDIAEDHSSGDLVKNPGKLKAISPFFETLHVFFSEETKQEREEAIITLLNTEGEIVIKQHVLFPFDQVSMPTNAVPAGLYVLQLTTTLISG